MKIRIPKDMEYLQLCDITNGKTSLMHWSRMYCWVDDSDKPLPFSHVGYRAHRGHGSSRHWNCYWELTRHINIGFRPAVEGLNTDTLPSDNGLVVLGTLYMDGKPVEVPQNPRVYGDIKDYIPGAILEMKAPLDDPDYQVKGFILGDGVAIADRVLLKYISYEDIENAINKEEGK